MHKIQLGIGSYRSTKMMRADWNNWVNFDRYSGKYLAIFKIYKVIFSHFMQCLHLLRRRRHIGELLLNSSSVHFVSSEIFLLSIAFF